MDFVPGDIDEFVALWHQEFGELLTEQQGTLIANLLVDFWWTITQALEETPNQQ